MWEKEESEKRRDGEKGKGGRAEMGGEKPDYTEEKGRKRASLKTQR